MRYNDDEIRMIAFAVDKPEYFELLFPELKDVRPLLYRAFEIKPWWGPEEKFYYYKSTIDCFLNAEFKDLLDEELISFLTFCIHNKCTLESNPLIYRLNVALNPKSCEDLASYIDEILEIVDIVIYDYNCEVQFLDKRFNEMYQILLNLEDSKEFTYYNDRDIIITILAYCHMNDLDYNIVYDFVKNKQCYKDKITMNGLKIEPSVELYNFIPHLLNKKTKKIIR